MKNLSSILALSFVVILLSSCFNKNNWSNNNTPLANNDVYMRGIKTVPNDNTFAGNASMRISRVEPAGDSIRLYTHIIDGDGMFASGAARGGFRNNWCYLTVNGNPVTQYNVQEVQQSRDVPTVYALVLDHSGSMGARATKMQEAVRNFINKKNPADAICIVKYDSNVNLEVPISNSPAVLQSQFKSNGLQGYGGTTAILNGIMKGMEVVQPSMYRRKVVISFTDGADNSSTVTKEYVTWYAQQNNINLCTIDFNNSNYNNFMQELANNTAGTYTYFTNTNQFGDVFDDVVNKMSHSYVVSYKRQTAGFQNVVLRYCGEPQALEATADFTPDRSNAQPVRNTTPPATNNSSASSADRPVYYRPASYYTAPIKGGSNGSTNNGGTGRVPTGGTSNPSDLKGSGGTDAGDLKGQPGQIRNPNGGTGTMPTKPNTEPGGSSGNTTKPGNSTGVGSGTKPDTSPIGGSGSNSNSGSMKDRPGQIRDGQGNTGGSPTKPDTNPSGGNSGGTTKPGNSSGVGSGTKPDTNPVGGSGSNSNSGSMKDRPGQIRDGQGNAGGSPTKPDTNPSGGNSGSTTKPGTSTGIGNSSKPDTNPVVKPSTSKPVVKPSTTKPASSSGSTTKPSTTKPSSIGSSGSTTKPASGTSGSKDTGGGLRQTRSPQ